MHFLVISTVRSDKPSTLQEEARQFWEWLDPLVQEGVAQHVFTKIGRGAVIIFDVESPERMHKIINEWSECIPASFEVTPLLPKKVQERMAFAGVKPIKP